MVLLQTRRSGRLRQARWKSQATMDFVLIHTTAEMVALSFSSLRSKMHLAVELFQKPKSG